MKKVNNIRVNGQEIELVKADGTIVEGRGWYLWNHHTQTREGTYRTRKAAVAAMDAM